MPILLIHASSRACGWTTRSHFGAITCSDRVLRWGFVMISIRQKTLGPMQRCIRRRPATRTSGTSLRWEMNRAADLKPLSNSARRPVSRTSPNPGANFQPKE